MELGLEKVEARGQGTKVPSLGKFLRLGSFCFLHRATSLRFREGQHEEKRRGPEEAFGIELVVATSPWFLDPSGLCLLLI